MSISENIVKKKIINHTLKNGKKQISEKLFLKSLKCLQKTQKKSHNELFKQSVINLTPAFRVIKLKKRKSTLEIPGFLSSSSYRASWGLKHLVKVSQTNNAFHQKLLQEIIAGAKMNSEIIKSREELYKTIIQKKRYFKFYRW